MWRHLKTVIKLCCSDTFMAHELYSDFAIQNTFMSSVVLVNEVSEVLQRHYPLSAILLTSLSIFAQLPTSRSNIFSTKALLAFWVIPNWFSKFCKKNDYLNSKLMLRWDSHFNQSSSHQNQVNSVHNIPLYAIQNACYGNNLLASILTTALGGSRGHLGPWPSQKA